MSTGKKNTRIAQVRG